MYKEHLYSNNQFKNNPMIKKEFMNLDIEKKYLF